MWSIYDTLILLTGLLTAAIAVLPVDGIPSRTRVTSGVIGGGLVVLALILGSLSSFTYPRVVFVSPLLPVAVAGSLIAQARRRALPGGHGLQHDEEAVSLSGRGVLEETAVAEAEMAAVAPDAAEALPNDTPDERLADWRAVHEEATSAERLAQIAAVHPEFGEAILAHANAYPELREWIRHYATSAEPSP